MQQEAEEKKEQSSWREVKDTTVDSAEQGTLLPRPNGAFPRLDFGPHCEV